MQSNVVRLGKRKLAAAPSFHSWWASLCCAPPSHFHRHRWTFLSWAAKSKETEESILTSIDQAVVVLVVRLQGITASGKDD